MPRHGRLKRIFENAQAGLDAVAIFNGDRPDPNFFYVSGYTSGLFENNALFLFPDGRVEVLTNPLEEQAARQKEGYDVHVDSTPGLSERRRLVSSILRGCRRVGLNFAGVSHRDFLSIGSTLGSKGLADVSGALEETRLVKDPDEVAAISRAARLISGVVDEVPGLLRGGMTERDLKAKIDYLIVEHGADSPSFDSIVAFGEHSALPHYSSGETRLRRGDNVLVDIGARYRLYCSDITRTFFFGRPATSQREAYAKVLEAQAKATAAIREGAKGDDVHGVAAKTIDRSRFKGRFIHGLGHSIGVEVHDGPGLSPRSMLTLKRDMVMTVEPGIYLPGEGGVRIEDDVVVTKDSCTILTTSPRELTEV